MHELSIAAALVEQVEELTAAEGATKIAVIRLRLGALCGVDPEALELAMPVAARAGPAANARLEIELVPARVRCNACGSCTQPEMPYLICQDCGSREVEVSAGRELELRSVELLLPEADPPVQKESPHAR